MRDRMGMRLDGREPALQRHQRNDAQTRLESVDAIEFADQAGMFVLVGVEPLEKGGVASQRHTSFRVQHIDRSGAFGLVPLADLEIVEVVRRGDFHRAGALFGIGIFVSDNANEAADEGQPDVAANQKRIALIIGMHRNRGVAEHGFRPGRRDSQHVAGVFARVVNDGILKVIEMPARVFG